MKAVIIKRPRRKFKSGALRDLVLHSVLGVVAIGAAVFFLICGFGYIKERIVNPMQNPDQTDLSADDVADESYSTPKDLMKIPTGTLIYSGAINTLAKLDFPQFKSAADIPDKYLIAFGLWQAVSNYQDKITTSNDKVTIPTSVVLDAAREFFDFDRDLTFEDNNLLGSFTYNAGSNSYTTDIYSIESTYLPRVKAVTEADNHITLKLEYVSTSDQRTYEENGGKDAPKAKKVVTIRVIANDKTGGYKILDLQPDV